MEDNDHLGQDIWDRFSLGEELELIWEELKGDFALKAMEREFLPDVVMMDLSMPDMDEIEATRLAK